MKKALVTGAGSGIGLATAKRLIEAGYYVYALDIHPTLLSGKNHEWLWCDLSHCPEIEKSFAKIEHLDVAINNAAILGLHKQPSNYPLYDWDRVIGTNLTSVWLCMQKENAIMDYGHIINISSDCSNQAPDHGPAYWASKHGINGLTYYGAANFKQYVNAICPGKVNTPMQDNEGISPEEIAELITGIIESNIHGSVLKVHEWQEALMSARELIGDTRREARENAEAKLSAL